MDFNQFTESMYVPELVTLNMHNTFDVCSTYIYKHLHNTINLLHIFYLLSESVLERFEMFHCLSSLPLRNGITETDDKTLTIILLSLSCAVISRHTV